MVRGRIILLFLIIGIPVLAQKSKLDSLDAVLNNAASNSEKIPLLKQLITAYSKSNITKSCDYVRDGVALNDPSSQPYFLNELGYCYRRTRQPDSAYYFFDKSQTHYLANKDSVGYYEVNYNIAKLMRVQGKFEEAIKIVGESVNFFRSKSDSLSKHRFLEGQVVFAIIYSSTRDHLLAANHLETVIDEAEFLKGDRLLNIAYINSIGQYTSLKEYDKGLAYAKKAISTSTSDYSKGHIELNVGATLSRQKKLKEAFNSYQRAKTYFEKANSTSGLISTLNNIGNNCRKRGLYKVAEDYLLQANALLKKQDQLSSLEANYEFLKNLYREQGRYEKASHVQDSLAKLEAKIFGKEKRKAISELQVKYETERLAAEKEVAESKANLALLESSRNRNNFIIACLIGALLLISSVFYVARLRSKRKEELVSLKLEETEKRLELEKQYRDSELKALKAQMNPHFIFNALTSIQDYIFLNKKKEAVNYLGKFAHLMRKYLEHSDAGSLSLREEIESLNTYLELEVLRFGDNLKYTTHVSDQLDLDKVFIPTMLIQPYVENSLKHGLLHRKDSRHLWLTIAESGPKTITCIIQDNGVGRKKAREIKERGNHFNKSFSSKATENRLELLNFERDRKIGVEITDLMEGGKPSGTKVELTIPILKEG